MFCVLTDLEDGISEKLKDKQIKNDTYKDRGILDQRALRIIGENKPVQPEKHDQEYEQNGMPFAMYGHIC
jgi:hypothetical protein